MATQTQFIEVTDDWANIGNGPAYIEAETKTYIHFGDGKPPNDTRARHKIGVGMREGIAVQSGLTIWVRSDAPKGGIVITEGV